MAASGMIGGDARRRHRAIEIGLSGLPPCQRFESNQRWWRPLPKWADKIPHHVRKTLGGFVSEWNTFVATLMLLFFGRIVASLLGLPAGPSWFLIILGGLCGIPFAKWMKRVNQCVLSDHAREDLHSVLQGIGVKARMAERGRVEEEITFNRGRGRTFRVLGLPLAGGWAAKGRSQGVIEIGEGPIRWVNVRRYETEAADSNGLLIWHSYEYGVPNVKITPDFPPVHLKLALCRKPPVLGPVVAVKWRGKDFGLGIVELLHQDVSIANTVIAAHRGRAVFGIDIKIDTHFEIDADPRHGWILTARADAPSVELWKSYESIAHHLLALPGVPGLVRPLEGRDFLGTTNSKILGCLLVAAISLTSGCSRLPDQTEDYPARIRPSQVREIRPRTGAQGQFEPSGLVGFENRLLVVTDEKEFPDIYLLKPQDAEIVEAEAFRTVPFIPGFAGHDFEGITFCKDRLFVVEEATSTVIEVDKEGHANAHPLDLVSIHKERNIAEPFGTRGAGLEGIACDEVNGVLYVAQERMFRMIYALDLVSFKAFDFFDVPAGWFTPHYVGGVPVYPDYADLYFENGFLYALQRNDRIVLKIEPKEKKLVSRLDLEFKESDYYDYKDPFGMAEGLYLSKDRIYIVLDNNGVARIGSSQNISSLLLEFDRPKGF